MTGKIGWQRGWLILAIGVLAGCQGRSPSATPEPTPTAIAPESSSVDAPPSPSASARPDISAFPTPNDAAPKWIQPGAGQTQTVTTATGQVNGLQVELRLGFGQVMLAAGRDREIESTFRYNRADWKPQVDYGRMGDRGQLVITQPQFPASHESFVMEGDFQNEWQVALPPRLPVDLTIDAGALDGKLDLSAIALERLHLRAGSGQLAVNTGVQQLRQLHLGVGAGTVRLKVPGGEVQTLTVETGAGNIELDLRGDWQANLKAELRGNGNVVLIVPTEVGVRLVADGLGLVTGDTLVQSGTGWVNSAYGRSPITLTIQQTGVGNVTVATR